MQIGRKVKSDAMRLRLLRISAGGNVRAWQTLSGARAKLRRVKNDGGWSLAPRSLAIMAPDR